MSKDQGRPRDARIDRAVLDAAAALLHEVGYADLTVAAIADRAGTSRPAVYRRWPSKAHLVHEAAFRDADTTETLRTGVLEDDLRDLVRRTAGLLASPLARLAVPGLVAEAAADPTLHARLLERFAEHGWIGVEDYLARAAEAGQVRRDVDAVTVLELAIGAALVAMLVHGPEGLDEAWVDRTTAVLLHGISPAAGGPPAR
ncbi:TetR/AcrR family transcriptional regulator [Nocardioides sp. SOB44]|uniref:TetR/AcrR family transcriptional regulator n=1 Tax=Nocardioides cremeus TaxID=3058044 RepID=A0ABT8TYN5_9ACTN|nr:TetR/AcrR family transcriptional regulator [Nocardioides cremeus]MDO3398118.1 TetR/AcrR family transcriptional regulator [Nocardioides cremeus]